MRFSMFGTGSLFLRNSLVRNSIPLSPNPENRPGCLQAALPAAAAGKSDPQDPARHALTPVPGSGGTAQHDASGFVELSQHECRKVNDLNHLQWLSSVPDAGIRPLERATGKRTPLTIIYLL
jgi:hypothetical protein